MTAPAEDPRGGIGPFMCSTCLGRGGSCGTCRGSGQTWSYVAKLYSPPAAGRGDTDSGGEVWIETPDHAPYSDAYEWEPVTARTAGDHAQPTQELREAIARWLFGLSNPDRYWEADWVDRSPIYAEADELLAGPLAALLDAQAAVSRVEGLWARYESPVRTSIWPTELRAALDGT